MQKNPELICDSIAYRENQSSLDLIKIYESDASVIDSDEKFIIYIFKNSD
ncbi:MAG TPA: hypothetical protein PKY81_04405 [bacterium]|nr:hypothetical protein [bacterium]